ncbi:hypothetical protein [Trujillonella endophytica]|uniref:Uncharacterized protein n=1 Tax=Trujillonella endophytica TaxID=673521 RepID=A0A1H8SZR7_9ACTN|nr:hypothetical protein [Trujillella endophytica]SEO84045.1 hypothetical protein SAMN05660991_01947 [Trujillella endophytica]
MGETSKPMALFLQDPSLPDLHADFDFATTGDFLEGAGSSRFCVRDEPAADPDVGLRVAAQLGLHPVGIPPMVPTLDWAAEDLSFARFEREGLVDNAQFHQVNVFAVCTSVLQMIEEELGGAVTWQGGGPLVIRPHAVPRLDAFYDPQAPSLNFGFASSPWRPGQVWTCLSHDVVSHELGHAVLATIRPGFTLKPHVDSAALHESFADLVTLFSALRHESVVRRVFEESGGDLRRPSVITRGAEEWGVAKKGAGFPYSRSTLEVLPYRDAPPDAHTRSLVWTGAVYELMVRLHEAARPAAGPRGARPAKRRAFDDFVTSVQDAARWTRGMVFRALHYLPPTATTLPLLARLVAEADARVFPDDSRFRDIAREVFTERDLWDDDLVLTPPPLEVDLEPLLGADSATLTRAVLGQADALGIPRGIGARILAPTLVSTTRRVDRVTDAAGVAGIREMTERYLCYGYEVPVAVPVRLDGGVLDVHVPLTFGGTLVLDDRWRPLLLATDPGPTPADRETPFPYLVAVARGIRDFQALVSGMLRGGRAGGFEADANAGVVASLRHVCHFSDHVRAVQAPPSPFDFAPLGSQPLLPE